MSIGASFDPKGILARYDRLAAAAKGAARPAAQAGIQVLYDEVRARVPVGTKPHSTKGKKHTFEPGNLRQAIYQAYADGSTPERATYRVSWNKKKAFYGHMVEHGTSRTAAQPFLRPAYDARREDARAVARAELHRRAMEGLRK